MPSASSQQTTIVTTLAIAILGLFFFTKKVVRAKAVGGEHPTSSSRPSSSRSGGGGNDGGSNIRSIGGAVSGGGGGGRVDRAAVAFGVGLLDIAIPRDDRPGGSFPRVMVNDACITRVVQEVSDKLVVSLRDADSMPAGVVRAYVSELYQEVYDAACAARRPDLDVRVLLPPSGASGVGSGGGGGGGGETAGPTPAPFTFNHGPPVAPSSRRSPPSESKGGGDGDVQPPPLPPPPTSSLSSPAAGSTAGGREFTVDLVQGWATRAVAELEPDLEVLFSDALPDGERQETVNAGRRLAGYSALSFCSLEDVASTAYRAEYFYAENSRADIPTFSSVACGGTFDRLHGGHKKLLTLAASMCADGTLTVGVTSDSMLKAKSNANMVTSLSERLDGVTSFLRTLNPEMQLRVEGITDPFGPPAVEEAFDAIVVSSETVPGAEKINELRAQKGFRPLAVAVTRRMAAATLSSSYLRRAAAEEDQQQTSSSRRRDGDGGGGDGRSKAA